MANKDDSYKLLPELIAQMDAMKPFTRREIQSLFDDCMEGTNQQLVYYLLGVVRLLASQNEGIPDYIENAIKEYISSGEIEKVLADVLAGYMLNVKNPPEGLKPAVGDGTANDTEAIQGCIDYAYNNGGMAVYFPSGAYLCSSLTLKDTTTLFGQDRYTTRIVLQGGATSPLLSGTASKLTISGIGLDGNGDVQVNNVNLVDVTVDNAIIINALLTDGFDLLKVAVNEDMQMSGVMLDHAINNALVLSGDGVVNAENITFGSLSTLVGEYYINCGVSNSTFTGLNFIGEATNYIDVSGNNNAFSGSCSHVPMPTPTVTGENNSFDFPASFSMKSYENDVELLMRVFKLRSQTNIDIEAIGKLIMSITGSILVNSAELTNTVTGKHEEECSDYKLTAHDTIAETTANRTMTTSGTHSVSCGVEDTTVDGKSTHSCSSLEEHVTGNMINRVDGSIEETTTKRIENVTDFDMNSVNPMQYKNPTEVTGCEYFDYVPMMNRNREEYQVLVGNEKTSGLSNISNRVSALEGQSSLQVNRKMIWLYDSIGVGVFSPAYVTGFPKLVQEWGGFTENENIFLAGQSGSGFNPPDASLKWEKLLSNYSLPSSIAKTAITDIFVVGGDNDVTNLNVDDPAPLNTTIQSFMNYVKENYPNAKVHVACIAYRLTGDSYKTAALNNIYSQCGRWGADFIENANFILHDTTFFGDDNIHVNQNGQNLLASYLLSVVNGGNIEVTKQYRACSLIKQGWINSIGGTTDINMEMHNNMIYCRIGTLHIDFNAFSGSNPLNGVDTNVNAAVLGDSYFIGDTVQSTWVTLPGFIILNRGGSDEYVSCDIVVRFVDRNMLVAPALARGSGGWENENGLRNISIYPASFVIPALSS